MLYKLNCSSLVLAACLATVLAGPPSRRLVLHEKRESAPIGFYKTGAAPPHEMLNLRLSLANNDMDGLQEALYSVSTPGSSLYGQHLSKEQVEEYVKPKPESVALINDFLTSHGVSATSMSPTGDWLLLSVPVHKANEMFGADFSVFEHGPTGKRSVRTLAYSIPTELRGHLNLLFPAVNFENPFSRAPVVSTPFNTIASSSGFTSRQEVPASCNSSITPACLQAMYGIPTTLATNPNNTIGVPGFINFSANHQDLSIFLNEYRPDIANTSFSSFSLQTINNGTTSQDPSFAAPEAELDIQYTVGLASGVPTTFISIGDHFENGMLLGFLDLANFLLNEENPPHVLSVSYGQDEDIITPEFANQLCNAFMQLGARGVSLLFASGDGGVSGTQPPQPGAECTNFVPAFPSDCPFVTSVGATTGIVERATNFSSGGFSNLFPMPAYQTEAVNKYLDALGSTNSGRFNRTGRAFPDLSAQGVNVEIVAGDGVKQTIFGASCSTPIFSSVIALLNDRLISAGKSPLGFLNPFLYSPAGSAALNDVVLGNNQGCGTEGFPAREGWDPVSGLGTPNFDKLLAAVGL